MKRITKIAAALGVALSAGLAATTLLAHPQGYGPGWGMRGGMGYGPGAGMGPGAWAGDAPCAGFAPGQDGGPGFGRGPGAAVPGAFFADRLESLKNELKITPAQEAAWSGYADEAKKQADAMQKLRAAMHGSTAATVPERLALRDQMWKQREAGAEAVAQKMKELYAALTPEQKSIADRRFGGHGPDMYAGPRFGWR